MYRIQRPGFAGPALFSTCLVLGLGACDQKPSPESGADETPIFELLDEATSGLDFTHENGMTGDLRMLEIIGAGAALLDYDMDGDLDLYLVQGGPFAPTDTAGTRPPPRDRLYRNDLAPAKEGPPRFTDVTEASGIAAAGYGMGIATADYDGDGWTDLYVTNFGPNQLWRNRGDGTFEETTAAAGVGGGSAWSTSAAFTDIDGDGLPDLYVANYVDLRLASPIRCRAANSAPDYCGPKSFPPAADRAYRNLGGGRFEEVTEAAGFSAVAAGAGLGVIARDFDADGRTDLFVANDGMENHLWYNRDDGTLAEQGLTSGVALNANGEPEASMGVTAGDFDDDGDLDLFMTHLQGETNTLYLNDGGSGFTDATARSRLGAPSRRYTGFGTARFDYDNDGRLDLFVANGKVRTYGVHAPPGSPASLAEPNQLFRGEGNGRFTDVSALAGEALGLEEVSRGAAFGDLDNDGRTDVVVTNNNGPVRVLLNRLPADNHWLGLELLNGATGGNATGARVEILTGDRNSGPGRIWRWTGTDGSYLSANDPRLLVGLGDHTRVAAVRVRWQSGTVEEWRDPAVDRYHRLVRGGGAEIEASAR